MSLEKCEVISGFPVFAFPEKPDYLPISNEEFKQRTLEAWTHGDVNSRVSAAFRGGEQEWALLWNDESYSVRGAVACRASEEYQLIVFDSDGVFILGKDALFSWKYPLKAVTGGDSNISAYDISDSNSSTPSRSSELSSAEKSEEDSDSEIYPTVKAFLEDPDVREEIDSWVEEMMDDDISVSVRGTENSLIYYYEYSDSALSTVDEKKLSSTLKSNLDNESIIVTFGGIAKSIDAVVSADPVKVVVVYAKSDGTELASREYFAE